MQFVKCFIYIIPCNPKDNSLNKGTICFIRKRVEMKKKKKKKNNDLPKVKANV